MSCELELTKLNRLRLARAFQHHLRVDYSIDCVVEGQMGRAFAGDLRHPVAFGINLGPFWYFAGDATRPVGQALIREWPAHSLLMPSLPDWISAARQMYRARLTPGCFPDTAHNCIAGELSRAGGLQLAR
jgi:hypothetical protein